MAGTVRMMDRHGGAGWFLLCVLLVAAYVNDSAIWTWLAGHLGPTGQNLFPVLVLPILGLPLAALLLARQRTPRRVIPAWLAVAFIATAIALWIADPTAPAKRIHVAQYALLALLVDRFVGLQLRAMPAFVMTIIIATLFGVHDEMLQGLHPLRTFGLPDILVDIGGAACGAALLRALGLSPGSAADEPRPDWAALLSSFLVLAGLILLLVAMPSFRHLRMPLWTLLPLLAACLGWWLDRQRQTLPPGLRATTRLATCMAAPVLLYPLIANAAHLDFN